MIAAQVVNVNLTKGAKHLQPADFFPMLKPRTPALSTTTTTSGRSSIPSPMTQAAFDEFRAKMLALGQTGKIK